MTDFAKPSDFAKIVNATNGQQVVFMLRNDSDGDMLAQIACVTRHRHHMGTITYGYDEIEKAQAAFDKIDQSTADMIVKGTFMETEDILG